MNSAAASFQLRASPPSTGEFCPGPLNLTCTGIGILSLFWEVNSTNQVFTRYAVRPSDPLPVSLPISPLLPGVTAYVTDILENENDPSTYDVTSVIVVGNASNVDGWSFECVDENSVGSAPINIVVNFLGE